MMVLVHLLACGACIANSLAMLIKLGLCIAISIHFWLIIKRLRGQSYQIRYSEKSGWQIATCHDFESIRISTSTLITTFVIILHIKSQNNNNLAILVLSDALCEDDYRQFIVKLKTTVIKQ
jgi:hypothetical protein